MIDIKENLHENLTSKGGISTIIINNQETIPDIDIDEGDADNIDGTPYDYIAIYKL